MKNKILLTLILLVYLNSTSKGQTIFFASNDQSFKQTEVLNDKKNLKTTYQVKTLSGSAEGVGIGTENPLAKLDILHTSSMSNPHLLLAENSPTNGATLMFKNEGSENTWVLNGKPATDSEMASLLFNYNGNGGGEVMTLTGNGNMGLGTTSPKYKLDVNGVMRANEIIVETDWADYVFEDSYPLKNIHEVEKYIKINKHLPGIPSAHEIQEKGASVSELITKMMAKIEELTLYSIHQQKEIDELKTKKNFRIKSLFKAEY